MSSDPSKSQPSQGSHEPREEASELLRLGAGSFATVYVVLGRTYRAIKMVSTSEGTATLEEEYNMLKILKQNCSGLLFRLPTPYSFNHSFHEYAHIYNCPMAGVPDRGVYSMTRVWPVPPALDKRIRQSYFPEEHRQAVQKKVFIARLYFGPTRKREAGYVPRFFNQNNFPLTTTMMEELGLPTAELATGMGRLLSRMHYVARLDGRDIEFVLGSTEDDEPAFWCIDFNQMKPWTDVDQLVSSFYDNDPYYPRPGLRYWEEFSAGYLAEAQADEGLAQEFLQRVTDRSKAAATS